MITNESIMDATLCMMAKHGIKGSTTRQLAEAAGINEATIFKKFKSKDNLIHMTLEVQFESMKAEINQFFDKDFESAKVFLRQASQFISDIYEKYRDFMVISVREMGSKDMKFIDPSIVEYLYERVNEKVKEMVPSKNSAQEADAISLILNSVILLIMVEKVRDDIYKRPPTITTTADSLADVLLKLLK
ncbi:TetR/AcrR family transcriptional regulator [Listeria monocytogenes]|nr:TetR/AcrR family transcriptional regulator [Listeria monocytogenes]